MTIPNTMTMRELRNFANKNGLWYCHVYGTKGDVLIYADRYHFKKLGKTFVTDYKPIRNYRSMKRASNYQVLQIVKKRIKDRGWGYAMSIAKPEEVEIVKAWLEEKE